MQGHFVSKQVHELQPGEYTFRLDADDITKKHWYAACPNGAIGNLDNHEVIEHEDATITVTPSILINRDRPNRWHGHLEHGVWKEAND